MSTTAQQRLAAIALLLGIVAVHQLGTGVIFALIPLRLALEGAPATIVGAISTTWSVGFLLGCILAPAIIARIGARPAITAGALLNAASAFALYLTDDVLAWIIARGLNGVATATLFSIIEAWLASQATAANRGTVFGIYMVVNRIVFTIGQLFLSWVDPRLAALFLIGTAAYVLAPLPALALRANPPHVADRKKGRLLDLPRSAPAAAAAALVHGLVTTAGPALFPVYGVARGLGPERIALVLAMIQFGGLLFQLPLTALSDRKGRRVVMGIAAATCMIGSLLLAHADASHWYWFLLLVAIWGGAPSALYALAAAHANDLAPEHDRTAWSASLMLNWGIGSMLGPILASTLMDWFGSAALFAFTGALSASLVVFVVWRRQVRPPTGERRPLDEIPGRTPGTSSATHGND